LKEQQQVTATEFKAHCLEWLSRIHTERLEIVVTKRGKPIARVGPLPGESGSDIYGCMKGSVTFLGDVTAPLDLVWDAAIE